uniref:SFRICE_027832 n=1 Tax=Spodoptera frugiperda TaxID=7108 RepID=A0A2H1WGZ9_SPOFR
MDYRCANVILTRFSVLEDRFSEGDLAGRDRRSTDNIYFEDKDIEEPKYWNTRPSQSSQPVYNNPIDTPSSAPISPDDEIGRFFVQYNNVPMGAERVDDRVFITIPRRRYGKHNMISGLSLLHHHHIISLPIVHW